MTGSRYKLPPIHQLTEVSSASAASAIPKAAGLKKCLPPGGRMYFEAIAQAEAKSAKPIAERSVGPKGVITSIKISAVISTDSGFERDAKTRAKMALAAQQAAKISSAENPRSIRA